MQTNIVSIVDLIPLKIFGAPSAARFVSSVRRAFSFDLFEGYCIFIEIKKMGIRLKFQHLKKVKHETH